MDDLITTTAQVKIVAGGIKNEVTDQIHKIGIINDEVEENTIKMQTTT